MILILSTELMITLLLYLVIHLCIVITSLGNAAEKRFEWFTNNHMKAHHDKCYLLMSTLAPFSIKVKDSLIKNSNNEKTFRCNN